MNSFGPRDLRTVQTSRLRLSPASVGDLVAMAQLHADERVWRHLPTGRHTSAEQTRTYLIERERQWRQYGLGYWIARLREPIGEIRAGQVVGIGGCAIPAGASWWNLYYRLVPEVHQHGLATELCRAALVAAHRTRRSVPVVAFLLEHNQASKATAERAGLHLVWRGADAGNPDSSAVRLIYADRQLDNTRLDALITMT